MIIITVKELYMCMRILELCHDHGIIESVDSISRDGPDMPMYNKRPKYSVQIHF